MPAGREIITYQDEKSAATRDVDASHGEQLGGSKFVQLNEVE